MSTGSVRSRFNPKSNPAPTVIDFRKQNIFCFASDFKKDSVATAEMPYIELVEYQPTASAFVNQANRVSKAGELLVSDTKLVFQNLYQARATGYVYILPYLKDYHHQISNNWQEGQGMLPVVSDLVDLVVKINKIMTPAAGFIYPKVYAGANENIYDVNFSLINTAPLGASEDQAISVIHQNKAFLEILIRQNLHRQSSTVIMAPPCLYTVYIPGIRYSPAAVVNSILVQNRGTVNNWGNYHVPDAWDVTIQIRELVSEYRAIYKDALQGRSTAENMSVQVISDEEPAASTAPTGFSGSELAARFPGG